MCKLTRYSLARIANGELSALLDALRDHDVDEPSTGRCPPNGESRLPLRNLNPNSRKEVLR